MLCMAARSTGIDDSGSERLGCQHHQHPATARAPSPTRARATQTTRARKPQNPTEPTRAGSYGGSAFGANAQWGQQSTYMTNQSYTSWASVSQCTVVEVSLRKASARAPPALRDACVSDPARFEPPPPMLAVPNRRDRLRRRAQRFFRGCGWLPPLQLL